MHFLNFLMLREFATPALVGALCFVLGTHQTQVLTEDEKDLGVLNGCVVSACNYLAVVKAKHSLEKEFWARVLLVRYENNSAGHAYCVWETEGTIYAYDRNSGGFPLPEYTKDPREIAEVLAVGLSRHLGETLKVASAEFVEPQKVELKPF